MSNSYNSPANQYVRLATGKSIPKARTSREVASTESDQSKSILNPVYRTPTDPNYKTPSFKRLSHQSTSEDSLTQEIVNRMIRAGPSKTVNQPPPPMTKQQERVAGNKYKTKDQKRLKRQRRNHGKDPNEKARQNSQYFRNCSKATAQTIAVLKQQGTPQSLEEAKELEKKCDIDFNTSAVFKQMHVQRSANPVVTRELLKRKI